MCFLVSATVRAMSGEEEEKRKNKSSRNTLQRAEREKRIDGPFFFLLSSSDGRRWGALGL